MKTIAAAEHLNIRDAVRVLCGALPAEDHRKVDPSTKAGRMAALAREEYGGA
jgi:hypothetical protein